MCKDMCLASGDRQNGGGLGGKGRQIEKWGFENQKGEGRNENSENGKQTKSRVREKKGRVSGMRI